jgi:beta-phosphoglucomutase
VLGYQQELIMIQAVIFDLDGTIVDTEELAFAAIINCSNRWGISVARADAEAIAGKKWEIAFELLCKKYQFPVPRQQFEREILDEYHAGLKTNLKVVPGVLEAITSLSKHFRLALVSGSFRRDIELILKKLAVFEKFEVVLGAEDYRASKPDPEGFSKAMRLLGVEPASCVVFEDSFPGIRSGISAGAYVVAVTSTNHFSQQQDEAHSRINNFLAVTPDWVKNLKVNP